MTFSLLVLIGVVMVLSLGRRRRYWEDWRRMPPYDPRGGPPAHRRRPEWSDTRNGLQEHVDALETRIVQLEERLDFTERLLQERSAAGTLGSGRTGSEAARSPESRE